MGVLGIEGIEGEVVVGRGAFGVVYRAWQPNLQREVAVKVLVGAFDDAALRRFQRECAAVGSLSQEPGVLTVYAAGQTAEGSPYLVMPFVEGGSLADRLADGPLPAASVVRYGVEVGRGLAAAHRRGVLHLDVKPGNVLVDGQGRACLVDFGIARFIDVEQGGGHTATVAGTPGFAGPEIFDGRAPSVASDVYGLGSTLHALAGGRPPFSTSQAGGLSGLLRQIAELPPPNLRPSGVPDALCAVIERAMAKEPEDRYATVEELVAALEEVGVGLGLQFETSHAPEEAVPPPRPPGGDRGTEERTATGAPERATPLLAPPRVGPEVSPDAGAVGEPATIREVPPPSRRRWNGLVVGAGALLLAIAVAAVVVAWPSSSPTTTTTTSTTLPPPPALAIVGEEAGTLAHPASVYDAAVGPDGARVAVAGDDGAAHVWDVGAEEPRTFERHEARVNAVDLSADGTLLATSGFDGVVGLWDVESGTLEAAFEDHGEGTTVWGVDLSPDATRVASAGWDGTVRLWEVGSEEAAEVFRDGEDASDDEIGQRVWAVAFSPDGTALASGGGAGTVWLRDLETGELATLRPTEGAPGVTGLAFSADGGRLAVSGWNGVVRVWDVERGEELVALPARAETRIAGLEEGDEGFAEQVAARRAEWGVSFSPDGRVLATAGGDGTVRLWDVASAVYAADRVAELEPTVLAGHDDVVAGLAFGADGTQLATASWDTTVRLWDVAVR